MRHARLIALGFDLAHAVGKPAPAGFLSAASRLGVDPDEMYMIDDLNNDVLAAKVVAMVGCAGASTR